MEQREHPRIQIPLLVEVTHPAVGTVQTTARDISAGGLFVHLPSPQIKAGGKLKLRLLNTQPTDTQPTPTVEMEVKRVTEDGLGLAFMNRTAQHLFSSVERVRRELEIGRDYFQVHQCIAITHAQKGVLLVQKNGKWLLPGHYLMVGESAHSALRKFAEEKLQLKLTGKIIPVATDSAPDIGVSEAATYSIIFTTPSDALDVKLQPDTGYKDWRWVSKERDLTEITFASGHHREEIQLLLNILFDNGAA